MTRLTQTRTCSPLRKKRVQDQVGVFVLRRPTRYVFFMTTPTSPGFSQRAMDVVFASLVSQLQPELREALISSGLDDPGLLRAYPRTPVEDLRALGLGIEMATSTTSSPSFPPSVPSSLYLGVAVPVSRPLAVLSSQRQGPLEAGPEMSATAARASDLALRTSSTLRPKGPERRRIMKKGSTLPTGVTDGSHEPWMVGQVFPQVPLFHRVFLLLLCLVLRYSRLTQFLSVHLVKSRLDFQYHRGWKVLRSRVHRVRSFLRIRRRLTNPH